jgi:putative membrane protein
MQKKTMIWLISISLFLIISSMVLWIIFRDNTLFNPIYGGHMAGGWMMPIGMLGMGILWFVVIMGIIKYFQPSYDQHKNAHEVLKDRLARGEISIEEYESLKKALKG